VKTDYSRHPDTRVFALEEGLAEIGRAQDVPDLIKQIEALNEEEFLRIFNGWPDLAEPEGVWGSIVIGEYAVMCQLDMPPKHKRALGAQPKLKIDRAGTPEMILRRLEGLG
jgi:hypothetical protein